MAEAWERSKKSGQKKLIFNGTVKVYLDRDCFGTYHAQACDEQHFLAWLKYCHTSNSLKRGFGSGRNMFKAVRDAIYMLKNNPDKSV